MTYEEAREFISRSNQYGLKPGLETISELLNRLGNPQEELKVIHVAGTNGKGSTCAFITSILGEAGYRVGRYLSPAVFSYRERIQIYAKGGEGKQEIRNREERNYLTESHRYHENSLIMENENGINRILKQNDSIRIEYITEKGVIDTIERIQPVCEGMLRDGLAHPTSFEIETAMAFLYLSWEKVDFAVIEAGLGGRLDATNIIKQPICSVIASISLDHMQYLGDTLEKIAAEKAGIIKAGSPAVTCRQELKVLRVLEKACGEKNTQLILSDFDKVTGTRYMPEETAFTIRSGGKEQEYKIRLLGEYQTGNALLALKAVSLIDATGYPVSENAVKDGLYHTKWSGRFEIIARRPCLIIDGAHNEDAARVLCKSIQLYFTNRRIIYMIGVLADKDYKSILRITAPLADVIITLTPDNSRALASAELAKEAGRYCGRVLDAGNVAEAVRLAYHEAAAEDVILAFGSLSFLGELADTLGIRKDDETYDR